MKVAILSSLYPPYSVGGAEKAVQMLAESLYDHGLEVFVISLHPDKKQALDIVNGIRVYRLPIDNVYMPWLGTERPNALRRLIWHLHDMWNMKAAKRVGRILRIEQPTILHTQSLSGFSVSMWALAKKLNIARVHTLQDYYALCAKTTLHRNGKDCVTRCAGCVALTMTRKLASGMVDGVVGISEFVLKRHISEGYFAGSQQVMIHNMQRQVQVKPSTNDDTLTFGFIGRVTEEKGIELLLRALAMLSGSPCRLKIAGTAEPRYRKELQRRYPDERVEWLGYTTAENFYCMVDVVVIPSMWPEPLAYTCIESLYAGKSVIASATGGLKEIATLARSHRLFPSGNVEALSSAMKEAIDDSTHWKQTRVAADEVLERFSVESVTDRYRTLYDSLAGR